MVIRDPSSGPTSRSRRCDLALGHRSHNRSLADHIESPDSPLIVAASLNDTCRTYQRGPAQSDPPQTPQFAARSCDRTAGPITRLWGSLWAHVSLREGGENAIGILIQNYVYGSSSGGRFDARSDLHHHPHEARAERHHLRQPEHPRPPPGPTPGAAGVRWMTQPWPPTWPSSTTPAGPRTPPRWRLPPSASVPRLADHPDPAGEHTSRVLAWFRRTAADRGRGRALAFTRRPPLSGPCHVSPSSSHPARH